MKESEDELDPRRLLKDWYFWEADRVSQRTDWFLISHAILLEAYFASYSHKEPGNGPLGWIPLSAPVAVLGLLSSFYWMATGIRTYWLIDQLGGYLSDDRVAGRRIAATWRLLFEERRMNASWQWARPNPLFLIVVPLLVVLVWSFMILNNFNWTAIAVTVLVCLVTTRISIKLGRHRDKPYQPPSLDQMAAIFAADASVDTDRAVADNAEKLR